MCTLGERVGLLIFQIKGCFCKKGEARVGFRTHSTQWRVAQKHACNANTEQALLSCDCITTVFVKWGLSTFCYFILFFKKCSFLYRFPYSAVNQNTSIVMYEKVREVFLFVCVCVCVCLGCKCISLYIPLVRMGSQPCKWCNIGKRITVMCITIKVWVNPDIALCIEVVVSVRVTFI